MHPHRRPGRAPARNQPPPRADLVGTGFAIAIAAVSFLTVDTIGGGGEAAPLPHGGSVAVADDRWQLVVAFAGLAAGLMLVMVGMMAPRWRDDGALARVLPFLRRAVDAALWNAWWWGGGGGADRRALPVPVVILLLMLCPLLEAWFDFI